MDYKSAKMEHVGANVWPILDALQMHLLSAKMVCVKHLLSNVDKTACVHHKRHLDVEIQSACLPLLTAPNPFPLTKDK